MGLDHFRDEFNQTFHKHEIFGFSMLFKRDKKTEYFSTLI